MGKKQTTKKKMEKVQEDQAMLEKPNPKMVHAILYSSVNRPGENDSGGAFRPMAQQLASHVAKKGDHATALMGVNCLLDKERVRKTVLDQLSLVPEGTLERVSFFGHGWKNGFQFRQNKDNIKDSELVALLKTHKDLKYINLYCCMCANGGGNFAEALLEAMQDTHPHIRVFAHWNAGHTAYNPCIDFLGPHKPVYFAHQTAPRHEPNEYQLNPAKGEFKAIQAMLNEEGGQWKEVPYIFEEDNTAFLTLCREEILEKVNKQSV